ncbi:hypothetical protein FLAG1_09065 [Fusarium langsethiae]|uniref:Uncharacterized protein n=1 Tax=Fusarium langsethiae TaxID=179993 RepID=A0A0M9ER34_FUSLA|nr:hypothetical protein FLAG1_09065 [Fusarium langsethiae]GKU06667.1 unnamed protein product [Fusarium langsethiae]GKU21851.1 unnamed protein product [Fusarium langsethiae]
MVRLSILATVLAAASSVQAATWCQCLFPDGSHCCVASGAGSCEDKCRNAGKPLPWDGGALQPRKQLCNAGGKSFGISFITAQGRTQCDTTS